MYYCEFKLFFDRSIREAASLRGFLNSARGKNQNTEAENNEDYRNSLKIDKKTPETTETDTSHRIKTCLSCTWDSLM